MGACVKGEPRYRIEIAEIMRQVKLLEKDLQTFVLGGGVAQHPGFHQAVRCKVRQLNHGYVQSPLLQAGLERYILPPALGNHSGVLGAIAMAIELAPESSPIARN